MTCEPTNFLVGEKNKHFSAELFISTDEKPKKSEGLPRQGTEIAVHVPLGISVSLHDTEELLR